MWPGLPARMPIYTRHGTTSLFAALEVASGKVHRRCFKRHTHVEFIAFLESSAKRYPGRQLHLFATTLYALLCAKSRWKVRGLSGAPTEGAWYAKRPPSRSA